MSDPTTTNIQYATPSTATAAARPTSPVARLLRRPRFLIAAGVLLICAVGFNAASLALQLHFRKQAMPLRVAALDDKASGIPALIVDQGTKTPRWMLTSQDQPMPPDQEKELKTKEHLTRRYVDLNAVTPAQREALKDPTKWDQTVQQILATRPDAVINVHMAYYTGLVDTVAHVPERCMAADGWQQTTGTQILDGPERELDPSGKRGPAQFRYLTFEDMTTNGRQTRHVGYLFHVNGEYQNDPYAVRKRLQSLLEKYGYYVKVELMTSEPSDRKGGSKLEEKSPKQMAELYADLLPEVERCVPDWKAANAAK